MNNLVKGRHVIRPYRFSRDSIFYNAGV